MTGFLAEVLGVLTVLGIACLESLFILISGLAVLKLGGRLRPGGG